MTITRTQHSNAASSVSSASISTALTGVAPGSLIVVSVNVADFVTTSNVKDDLNVNAAVAYQFDYSAHQAWYECWYFANHGGGTRTFTANFSAAGVGKTISVTEYAGALAVAPFFNSVVATGNSAALSSGALTPPMDGCLIWGQGTQDGDTPEPDTGAGYAQIGRDDVVNVTSWEDKIQSLAASVATTWTGVPSLDWLATMAIFQPAAQALPVDTDFLLTFTVQR